MSGTSLDGIDTVLVKFSPSLEIIHTHYFAFDNELQEKLRAICFTDNISIKALGELDTQLGIVFADCVKRLLEEAQVSARNIHAIGCHGQTVFHSPAPPWPFSLQIGDPNHIAKLTGVTTVADFRRKDIAAGGQGAPLVPPFHQALFQDNQEDRVILNLGGIANVTILPSKTRNHPVLGYDTGPANSLLDCWINKCLGKKYDQAGQWAKSGVCNNRLLEHFLDDPYFNLSAPKSTGKEYFDLNWLENKLYSFPDSSFLSHVDVQTTLANLTAHSIANSLFDQNAAFDRLYVCGGGVYNEVVMEKLKYLLQRPVESTQALGMHPDWVEATAFAWLAMCRLESTAGNLPEATGAKSAEVLGAIYSA